MDVTISPTEARRLCDAAGVLTGWFPGQQVRIERTLALLLSGAEPSTKADRAVAIMLRQRSERQ